MAFPKMLSFMAFIAVMSMFISSATANVEKVIFIAPEPLNTPNDLAIDNLLLERIHPKHLSSRIYLNASFPNALKPDGEDTWALLEGLNPAQRYELRICWLATQPTAFKLDTFTISEAFENSELITSLSAYSYQRHGVLSASDIEALQSRKYDGDDKAALLLRVQAAADYFSPKQELMDNVPPVHVDLILDPYLFNIFPQSLLPTAAYLIVVGAIASGVAFWVSRRLFAVSAPESDKKNL